MPLIAGRYTRFFMFLTSFSTCTSVVNAHTFSNNSLQKDQSSVLSYVSTLSIGIDWENEGENQTINLQSDLIKTYTANKHSNTLANGELFFGVQRALQQGVQGQLGLELALASHAQVTGDIWDDANPNLNNFIYRYKLSHSHLAIKSKFIVDKSDFVSPYVFGSIGWGNNDAEEFIIVPKNPESVPAPAFLDHSQNSLTYTLGVGLQKAMNNNWLIGIGYEFANWGKSSLAPAPGQTMGQGPQLSHLYTHQLQCSLSYKV